MGKVYLPKIVHPRLHHALRLTAIGVFLLAVAFGLVVRFTLHSFPLFALACFALAIPFAVLCHLTFHHDTIHGDHSHSPFERE